jgi:regulator of protease activity HflC (stomatin/prohibitin superfamily)
VAAAGLFLLYEFWVWEIERVEVPADHFLVKIHLWGNDLPEGEIVAPDPSYKGIQRETLAEGRHFINPLFYTYRISPATIVAKGECKVVTRLAGPPIPPDRQAQGEFLAQGTFDDPNGERGILEKYLKPGKYYINPFLYSVEPGQVVNLQAHQVGVRTLKWGKDPALIPPEDRKKNPYVVPAGYRGVQVGYLKPETRYINPYVESIDAVDISKHVVQFTDIVFPSRDGFDIRPRIRVSYQVTPEKAPEVFVVLTDQGALYQADKTPQDQEKNQILQKFILPLVRGTVRIEGSKYDARDFISQQEKGGNPLKRLQLALEKSVTAECEKMGVRIDSIAVMQPELGRDKSLAELAEIIAQRDNTVIARRTNEELVKRHLAEQELKAKELLAEQEQKVTEAKGRLDAATEKAKQDKEVAEIDLKQQLQSAEVRLAAARSDAKAMLSKAQAKADNVNKDNEAAVSSLKTAIAGFPTPDYFAQYQMLNKLAPTLAEIFASDQSEFARLFTGYMTPSKKSGGTTAAPARTTEGTAAAGPAGGSPDRK